MNSNTEVKRLVETETDTLKTVIEANNPSQRTY